MVTTEPKLDYRLVRAHPRRGRRRCRTTSRALRGYLRMIETLLAEKAAELEPSWEQACAVAAEIETLQALEVGGRRAGDRDAAPTASRRCAASSRSGARSAPGRRRERHAARRATG